jgi:hypothetical protein
VVAASFQHDRHYLPDGDMQTTTTLIVPLGIMQLLSMAGWLCFICVALLWGGGEVYRHSMYKKGKKFEHPPIS